MGNFGFSVSVFIIYVTLLFKSQVRCLSPVMNDDVLGLIVFKSDLNDFDGKLSSWNEDDDAVCNNWIGVKCNPRSNRVSELVLDGFGLSGKLGRGLLQLKFLRKLSLAKNNLTGIISLSFDKLSELKVLDLSENGFSGLVPSDLFTQCGSLRSISLAGNMFSGPVPVGLSSCASLISLNLSGNQFSGQLPLGIWSLSGVRTLDLSDNLLEGGIPKEIRNMISLRVVSLRNNRFSGEVPVEFGKCLLLRSIDMSGNTLSGELPSTMEKLFMCTDLILARNAFGGAIPEWVGEMRSLESLDLSGNSFSGKFPASLKKLQSLKFLNVSKNALKGRLPVDMTSCVNLLVFDVSHNLLTGNFPSWMFKLELQQVLFSNNRLSGSLDNAFASSMENSRNKLVIFDVSQNKLSGEIPSSIGDFGNLQLLKMAGNSFVGAVPQSIGQLKNLNILDLSENWFNGSVPFEIGGLTSLNQLKFEKNSLGGNIPITIGDCASLVSLSLAHNEITGSIPSSLAKLTNLQVIDLSFNKLTGPLPNQLSNLLHLNSFNISHNKLLGELPSGGFFDTISPSSFLGNPSICGVTVNKTCPKSLPKPIVLDPSSTEATPDNVPQTIHRKKTILSISALVAIGAAAVIVVGVIAITVLNLRVRSLPPKPSIPLTFSRGYDFSNSPSSDSDSGKLVMFSGNPEFKTGTQSLLNKESELGRGGFGVMYKAMLKNGRPVAIKKLNVASLVKSQDEFEVEVKKLGKIRHVNLVSLDGYFWTQSLQLLIYEFVNGGNLCKRLHQESSGHHLSWNERFNIILGTAKGLSHLHQMNVIHYNLKSSNILIDGISKEAKVSDYGLARLLPMLDRYMLSSKVQSALGYMAPEFACKTVKITEKSDIYGFGILILETVTGKRPVEYLEDDVVVLCDMVREALDEGRVEECVDSRMQGEFEIEEMVNMVKLGLICTSQVPSNRPGMEEVVSMLELIKCPSGMEDEFGDSS